VKVLKGGPVETGRGFVLHSADFFIENSTLPIDNGICLTATLDILKAIAHGEGPQSAVLALGYAGWAPGQLENEITQNGWLNCDADPELIFGQDIGSKYEKAMRKIGIDLGKLSSEAGHALAARVIPGRCVASSPESITTVQEICEDRAPPLVSRLWIPALATLGRNESATALHLARRRGVRLPDQRDCALRLHRLAEHEALRVFAAELVELGASESVSAPSAITSIERSCAIAMIERRMTGRVPLPFWRTKDWSILIVSNGKRCR